MDASQTRFIMDSLVYLGNKHQGSLTLLYMLDQLYESLSSPSLSCPLYLVSPWAGPNGAYIMFRKQKIAAAVNRLRSLVVRRS